MPSEDDGRARPLEAPDTQQVHESDERAAVADASSQSSEQTGHVVTSVIRHIVKPGAEVEYETLLKKLSALGHHSPGHRGANIIRPSDGSHTYTIVVHFDTIEHLQAWLNSEARKELMGELKPLLAQRVQVDIQTGLDFWFTPPAATALTTPSIGTQKQVKPYKQFLVVLSAIYPLTILVHWALTPLADAVPFLGEPYVRAMLDAVTIVAFLTFLIMPHYTRMMAKWLYD